jgi:hypothetical protein
LPLRNEGRLLWCKAWNFGDRLAMFEPGTKLDVLFTVDDDPGSRARGYDGWSFSVKDARPAQSA